MNARRRRGGARRQKLNMATLSGVGALAFFLIYLAAFKTFDAPRRVTSIDLDISEKTSGIVRSSKLRLQED